MDVRGHFCYGQHERWHKLNFIDRLYLAVNVLKSKQLRHDSIFINQFKELDVVDRIEYLVNSCKGKSVLHIGFLDSPFLEEKFLSSEMLHSKLKRESAFVYGVDVNAKDLEKYRLLTGDENNCVINLSERGADLRIFQDLKFDVVLIPEVLEHISNPGEFLKNLYLICKAHQSNLIVTVPNAFNFEFFLEASDSREIVHPDHYFYFSPITIRKLLESESFFVRQTSMYTPGGSKKYRGITQWGVICLCEPRL